VRHTVGGSIVHPTHNALSEKIRAIRCSSGQAPRGGHRSARPGQALVRALSPSMNCSTRSRSSRKLLRPNSGADTRPWRDGPWHRSGRGGTVVPDPIPFGHRRSANAHVRGIRAPCQTSDLHGRTTQWDWFARAIRDNAKTMDRTFQHRAAAMPTKKRRAIRKYSGASCRTVERCLFRVAGSFRAWHGRAVLRRKGCLRGVPKTEELGTPGYHPEVSEKVGRVLS